LDTPSCSVRVVRLPAEIRNGDATETAKEAVGISSTVRETKKTYFNEFQ